MTSFSYYQTDRLSSIPNMASAISKKISEFQFDYRKMLDEAKIFFSSHYDFEEEIVLINKNMAVYQEHIDTVENYRKDKGKLPIIKGQRSALRYLEKLNQKLSQSETRLSQIKQERFVARGERYIALEKLVDNILDLLDGPKIFSQFLGTMALSTPLPNESVRCIRNEKNKPIYVTALTVALFEEVRQFSGFETPYLKDAIDKIASAGHISLMQRKGQKESDPQIKMAYREEVLKPIVKATLLYHIGSYSPKAENIYKGDRFRFLSEDERELLRNVINQNSNLYLNEGIGIPERRFDNKQAKEEFVKNENNKLDFMSQLLDFQHQGTELRDLMRIPMVYGSFILSTKHEFDYTSIYCAYDILKDGMKNGEYNPNFCALFLRMVGRFPIGSGIYFISKETGMIEKGIVSSLFPRNPESPFVKQITRNQLQSLSQTEVIVCKDSNIYFQFVRDASEFDDNYYATRYSAPFVWNANEVWEVQVPALIFWKKDGTVKKSNLSLLEN